MREKEMSVSMGTQPYSGSLQQVREKRYRSMGKLASEK